MHHREKERLQVLKIGGCISGYGGTLFPGGEILLPRGRMPIGVPQAGGSQLVTYGCSDTCKKDVIPGCRVVVPTR